MVRADKGRKTVVLDENDYIQKAKQLLNDSATYRLLDTDLTAKLETKNNKSLKRLQCLQRITKEEQ